MPLTITLGDGATGTILRSLTREAENREVEAVTLTALLEAALSENSALRDKVKNLDLTQDEVHDRLMELTEENRVLTNKMFQKEVEHKKELTYYKDQLRNASIENEALIDWNEEASMRLQELAEENALLYEEMDRTESYVNHLSTPDAYDIPNDAILRDYEDDHEGRLFSDKQHLDSITA